MYVSGESTKSLIAFLYALATVATTGFAPKTLKWTSSNETVATVDATGCITAVANGTATITAKSDFDGTKTATISVTVGA